MTIGWLLCIALHHLHAVRCPGPAPHPHLFLPWVDLPSGLRRCRTPTDHCTTKADITCESIYHMPVLSVLCCHALPCNISHAAWHFTHCILRKTLVRALVSRTACSHLLLEHPLRHEGMSHSQL